ncbi:MAG: adenosylcobinamide-phosphate synthase CbiB [Pirellulales bacterium]|nr:adenosylcobinamide-phosphate synthase CbiB [Pirellulales bacterium]
MSASHLLVVLVVAVLIDLCLGEPANRWHPVAWMGAFIGKAGSLCPAGGNAFRFLWGCMIVLLGVVIVALTGWAIERLGTVIAARTHSWAPLAWPAVVAIEALVLKCCFGIRSLHWAAASVLNELEREDQPAARQQLAYHLVSRDVNQLSVAEISAATIESVAENTSDSVVAPLFCYVVAGLPGALVYRYVNTCDAMLGYRTPPLEWLGKAAARTDDVLNLIPARITALLIIATNAASPGKMWRAFQTWRRDRGETQSPNGGHPISAASGVLGVRLEKLEHYCLGRNFRVPGTADVRGMLRLFRRTVVLALIVVALSQWAANYLVAWRAR